MNRIYYLIPIVFIVFSIVFAEDSTTYLNGLQWLRWNPNTSNYEVKAGDYNYQVPHFEGVFPSVVSDIQSKSEENPPSVIWTGYDRRTGDIYRIQIIDRTDLLYGVPTSTLGSPGVDRRVLEFMQQFIANNNAIKLAPDDQIESFAWMHPAISGEKVGFFQEMVGEQGRYAIYGNILFDYDKKTAAIATRTDQYFDKPWGDPGKTEDANNTNIFLNNFDFDHQPAVGVQSSSTTPGIER